MNKVLLISMINWDSMIEIPALIQNGGCEVDIFSRKNSWALQNNYHKQWIEASDDDTLFVDELIAFVEKYGDLYSWVIPGDDIIIRLLNERITDEKLFYKLLPVTKIENRALLGSKAGFSELCTKYGIKTPRYLVYNEGMSVGEIGKYMGYPLLMKLDKSEGGYGVFLCNDEASLKANLDKAVNKENMVFQQFIQGYDINTEVLYKNGTLMVYSYSRTLTIMGAFGVSTQRSFYQNPEIEAELVKIGESLGVNGFGNVVFMYSEPERTHYLIEVDVRPNAWMYYGKFMGNDFSEAIRKVYNNDLTLVRPSKEQESKTLKISLYKKDVYRCLVEKDFKGLMQWAFNVDGRWKYIPFYDRKLLRACNKFLYTSFKEMLAAKVKKKKAA